jgi:glucose/arabinose dehydrogenase
VSAANADAADPASELVLIQQYDQASNHNGGDLHFGPDGYLYISVGDEGAANDAFLNSQRITRDFFSGILRIDVDRKAGSLAPNPHPSVLTDAGVARYTVPVDNPFVATSLGGDWNGTLRGARVLPLARVRTEFWAIGLRNPWRFSFDSATGELWVGDVGQGVYEEVAVVTRGANLGWAIFEGTGRGPRSGTTWRRFDLLYHTRPVYQYPHLRYAGSAQMKGNSVTGGLVYRGTRFPNWQGRYFFADFVSGNIWSLMRNEAAPPTVTWIAAAGGVAAFGLDPSNGDVLLADFTHNRVLRLTEVVGE